MDSLKDMEYFLTVLQYLKIAKGKDFSYESYNNRKALNFPTHFPKMLEKLFIYATSNHVKPSPFIPVVRL